VIRSRVLTAGLCLGGFILLSLAVLDYFHQPDGSGVTIEEPEREFPAYLTGKTTELAFRIHNPTRHTARVVGLEPC
jgi:hypothetical protein